MINIETQSREQRKVESAFQERHFSRLKRNIVLLYLIRGISSIHFFGSVMILFFEEWGGISFADIMILEAIFTGGIFFLEIPTGTVADKYSRRLSLILSYFVNIIAVLVYISYPSFLVFAAGELIWALSVALNSGASDAFLYDSLVELHQDHHSKKYFAQMQSIGLITMILGSMSGGFIAAQFGLRATMLYSAIPLVISFFLSLFLEEPKTHQASRKERAWVIFIKGWKNIRKSLSLQRLIADSVVLSVIAYYILWIWQKRVMVLELDIQWFGIVHSSMILAQVVVLAVFRPLERWLEKRGWQKAKILVLRATGLGTGVGFILMGVFQSIEVVLVGIIIGAGFGLSRRIILSNYMQKHIESEQRATTISTVSMIRMLLLLILNPIVGQAVEWNMNATLIILGAIAVLWSVFNRLRQSDLHE